MISSSNLLSTVTVPTSVLGLTKSRIGLRCNGSSWDSIVYCSSSCKRPLGALDRAFETGILELLSERREDAVGVRKWEMEFVTCEEVEGIVMEEWK